MMPVRGRLDLRCCYGAPWRIEQGPGGANGRGERRDLLCGHVTIALPHDRLLRNYLPPMLIVHAGFHDGQNKQTRLPGSSPVSSL